MTKMHSQYGVSGTPEMRQLGTHKHISILTSVSYTISSERICNTVEIQLICSLWVVFLLYFIACRVSFAQ